MSLYVPNAEPTGSLDAIIAAVGKPYFRDDAVVIYHADCRDILPKMPKVDAIVTDPPYGLEFMGKEWDRLGVEAPKGYDRRGINEPAAVMGFQDGGGGNAFSRGRVRLGQSVNGGSAMQAWHHAWAVAALRVLKPGGHLLAFGGTRTHHRLMCALEDAGFEIRDTLMWLYGSGFPKSLDVSKAIDKAAGAEREVVGSEPSRMPQAQAADWGNPGIDSFRDSKRGTVDMDITVAATDAARQWDGWGTALKPAWEPIILARKPLIGTVAANVQAHGTGALNVDGCRIGTEPLEAHGGGVNRDGRKYGGGSGIPAIERGSNPHAGRWPANLALDEVAGAMLDAQSGERKAGGKVQGTEPSRTGQNGIYGIWDRVENAPYDDSGGASRFFYVAKASREERGEGNNHPTVKPIALMRWLVRLVTPPGGLILDPFIGSGTTAVAAVMEGFRCIGIDNNAEYLATAQERVERANLEREHGSEGADAIEGGQGVLL